MKINWQPHPGPQTQALTRTEFEVLYGGARGGGKTDAGMAWLLRHINNPLYRALIIRRNAEDLTDWISRAKFMYRDTGADFVGKPTEIRFPSGATLRTGHLKDADSYTKYQGHEYQRILIEELTHIPREDDYEKLISSCRSSIDIFPQVFATTNPGGVGHSWVKQRFIDVQEWGKPYIYDMAGFKLGRIFIPAKVEDNPTIVEKDPRYIAFLESLKERNTGLYRAWRHGDWDVIAGMVFSEWRRDKHVVDPFQIPFDWKKYIAMDWGVNAPFAVGWYAQDFDGRTFLYRELYMNGQKFENEFAKPLTPSRLARLILAITQENKETYEYCVADPSMWNKVLSGKGGEAIEGLGESIAETMMNKGLRMIKADNNRINGLGRFREQLGVAPDGKPWYQVFSTCKDTIRTIPSLAYDSYRIEDVDTDGEDHCFDRDKYFFMSRPQKSVESLPALKPLQAHYRKLIQGDDDRDPYQEFNS